MSGVHSQTSTRTTRDERRPVVGQHLRGREAQELEERVGHADARVVDQPPHDADDDRRDRHRQDEADADRPAEAELARDQHRKAEPEQCLDRDGRDDVLQGRHHRVPEERVVERVSVVREARVAVVPPVQVPGHARADAVEERVERDAGQRDGGRKQQQVGPGGKSYPPGLHPRWRRNVSHAAPERRQPGPGPGWRLAPRGSVASARPRSRRRAPGSGQPRRRGPVGEPWVPPRSRAAGKGPAGSRTRRARAVRAVAVSAMCRLVGSLLGEVVGDLLRRRVQVALRDRV